METKKLSLSHRLKSAVGAANAREKARENNTDKYKSSRPKPSMPKLPWDDKEHHDETR